MQDIAIPTKRKRTSVPLINKDNFKNLQIRLPNGMYKKLQKFTVNRDYRFVEFLIDILCLLESKNKEELKQFTNDVMFEKYFK